MIDAKTALLIGFVFTLVNSILAYLGIVFQYEALYSENALLENAQVLFLAVAAIGYLVIAPSHQYERLINSAIALLCFSFVLRELDIEHLNLADVLVTLGSGTGRNILLAFLWVSLSAYGFATINNKLSMARQFISSYAFLALTIAFLLLMVGAVMDRKVIEFSHAVLIEELAETNAYFVIALPVLVKAISWAYKTAVNSFTDLLVIRQASNQSEL
jgi:hypothetical protein